MKKLPVHLIDPISFTDVLMAGQRVAAGIYRDVENGREIILDREGFLPAACDGRVAAYVLRPPTWGELNRARREKAA